MRYRGLLEASIRKINARQPLEQNELKAERVVNELRRVRKIIYNHE
jgi:hypothetical protein